MTDNGSCYRSKVFRKACVDRGIKHVRTRPYTPKTNGKAELIQTAFDSLPKRGRIDGANLLMLQGLVSLLRDADGLVEHGQMVIDGTTSRDVLGLLLVKDEIREPTPVPEDITQIRIIPPPQAVLPNCGLW